MRHRHTFAGLSIILVSLASCQPVTGRLGNLSVGMSKPEVIKVMGKPDSVSAKGATEELFYHMSSDSHVVIFNREALPLYVIRLERGRVTGYEKVSDGHEMPPAGYGDGTGLRSSAAVGSDLGGDRVIESRIDGEFDGFDDGKIFKLLNGQIWQQAGFLYRYRYRYAPNVIIFKDGGLYRMKVDGVDDTVPVVRLR